MTWTVVLTPHSEYDEESGKNMSGLIVALSNDSGEYKEMSRVAFSRRHGSSRQRFKAALMEQIEQAQEAVDAVNKHAGAAEQARKQAEEARREAERAAARTEQEHQRVLREMRARQSSGVV